MTTDSGTVPASDTSKPVRKGRGWKIFVRDILIIFVAALLISFLIKTFLIRSFYIPSSSMEQTLHIDDRIIVNQLTPNLMPLEHGDVVVFKDPGGWLTPQPDPQVNWFVGAVDAVLAFVGLSAPDSNDHLIKRVIGMPGDEVICCNDFGQLTVNGVPLDEPYLDQRTRCGKSEHCDVVVPAGDLFVMGDNRGNSSDSRVFGPVPIDSVIGKAWLGYWPLDAVGFVPHHDYPEVPAAPEALPASS